ncbi:hypothetical protein EIN_281600 [Entamoeba invadens IP1]|uniref:TLDc domain-containing protein n=1 Tax=Entamoeba invadens IP1 TaxID=370355 RepID=A0A0A1U2M0_ENTIV|nr:hypothetical protein EIN_281600 [Entamoeba invadens IP1]ELP85789.1 hypothetical protein EIN_281600 [Entamoeba invadens IP1]|eukprot:XP_004185135.1 hypothetical protein EIN_281600 [Entamoeba invadens IP1]
MGNSASCQCTCLQSGTLDEYVHPKKSLSPLKKLKVLESPIVSEEECKSSIYTHPPSELYKRKSVSPMTPIRSVSSSSLFTKRTPVMMLSTPSVYTKEKSQTVLKDPKRLIKRSTTSSKLLVNFSSKNNSKNSSGTNTPINESSPAMDIASPDIQILFSPVFQKTPTILFDTNEDGWDTKTFNAKISCKKNVMVVCVLDDKSYLGVYSDALVPMPPKDESVVVTAKNTLLFSSHPSSESPLVFEKYTKNTNCFTMHSNTQHSLLFTCFSAFWIKTNQMVSINSHVAEQYEITTTRSLFWSSFSKEYKCNKVLAVEWI